MNKAKFIQHSSISKELINAVIAQIGGWDNFKNYAPDVTNHGAASGFVGFTYYSDTVQFAHENNETIGEMAREMASNMGFDDELELYKSFNCFKDLTLFEIARAYFDNSDDNHTQVANGLAWFALEEVCRSYVDCLEN